MKRRLAILPAVFTAALLAIPMPMRAADDGKLKLRTVVIDPGHGGHDPGCISRDRKTSEKSLTLDISQRLARKIATAWPDVKVIMTRSDDRYIELEQRAMTANNAGADLFISIHINSVERGTTASGYSVHCLGHSARTGNDLFSKNLDLVKRENSVILLEDDYKTKYQGFDPSDPQSYIFFSLMQNAHLEHSLLFAEDVAQAMGKGPIKKSRGVSQDPFWVLWRTAMPSVLIEVGFITNPDDLAVLRSPESRDRIADNLLKAFSTFKMRYDGTMRVETPDEPGWESETKADTAGVFYGTQVLATGRKMSLDDPFFQGNQAVSVESGRLIKYIVGTSGELEKARDNFRVLRKKYPDSFLVRVQDGRIERIN